MKVPNKEDWGDYEKDLDANYAFKVFFGRTISEVVPLFGVNPLERTNELRFMRPIPFRYYILAFRDYLLSKESRDDADAASCYLSLIGEKIMEQPDTIGPVFPALMESMCKIAENQDFYDADEDIYGNFEELRERIMAAYEKHREHRGQA